MPTRTTPLRAGHHHQLQPTHQLRATPSPTTPPWTGGLDLVFERAASATAQGALQNALGELSTSAQSSNEPNFRQDGDPVDETLHQSAVAQEESPHVLQPSHAESPEEDLPIEDPLAFIANFADDTAQAEAEAEAETSQNVLPLIMDAYLNDYFQAHHTPTTTPERPRTSRVRAPEQEDQDETPAKRRK